MMSSFQRSAPTAAGALSPAASLLSPRAHFQYPTRSQKASKARSPPPPPLLLVLPEEVLGLILGFVDLRSLTAFSLCSRECLAVPNEGHWEALWERSYMWLVNRKPARFSWRSFVQRLHEATSSTEQDKCGRLVVIGGSATHHHPLRRMESLPDLGESLRGSVGGGSQPRHKVRVEMELKEPISAPGVTRDDLGRVLVIGGWSGIRAVQKVEKLDTVTGLWDTMPSLQHGRCFLASVTDRSGNHYAIGGGTSVWRGAVVYNSVEILRQPTSSSSSSAFDSSQPSSAWTDFPSMRVARCGHQAAVTSTDHIYVAGGYGGGTEYLSSMEYLDPQRGCWMPAPDMAVARSGLGMCFGPDQCIYAVGGSQDGVISTAHAERYDPRRGVWECIAPMPVARGYCAAAFGLSGQLYVTGGQKSFANPPRLTNNVDIFDVRMGRWFSGPTNPGRLDLAMIWALPV